MLALGVISLSNAVIIEHFFLIIPLLLIYHVKNLFAIGTILADLIETSTKDLHMLDCMHSIYFLALSQSVIFKLDYYTLLLLLL